MRFTKSPDTQINERMSNFFHFAMAMIIGLAALATVLSSVPTLS